MVLERIEKENDIKKLSEEELKILADEIRAFLIQKISETGGHLASNLGVVELTMALHLTLDLPKDKLIWDVGHQSYTHKLLTGRREGFDGLRKYGGMSGFPKRKESACDCFDTGHSSTSLSAGLGYVYAREITGADYQVISVIGDGALTGGMAFEALNNAARLKSNFTIVLNDNNMSISENVGGLSSYLAEFRTADAYRDLKLGVMNSLNKILLLENRMVERIRRTKSGSSSYLFREMLFEEMGIIYLGPVDGGDMKGIAKLLREASHIEYGPVDRACDSRIRERGMHPQSAIRHASTAQTRLILRQDCRSIRGPRQIIPIFFPRLCASLETVMKRWSRSRRRWWTVRD